MEQELKGILLGEKVSAPLSYSPEVLFRVPRSENREQYDIKEDSLPFIGYDIWNCYEISFLTRRGLPINRVLKIKYSSSSEYIVESKSLKLYLNSFNMHEFPFNKIEDCSQEFLSLVESDLSKLLETEVYVELFDESASSYKEEISEFPNLFEHVEATSDVELVTFSHFKEAPELLQGELHSKRRVYKIQSDLLRSNCRVTHQPDWGNIYIYIESQYAINMSSLLQYIVSFRKENHFHEEVVEMIYKRLWDKFSPSQLLVAAKYTRRGGIDINPIRVSNSDLLSLTSSLVYCHELSHKTLRQ